jgi:hypothetical protein
MFSSALVGVFTNKQWEVNKRKVTQHKSGPNGQPGGHFQISHQPFFCAFIGVCINKSG